MYGGVVVVVQSTPIEPSQGSLTRDSVQAAGPYGAGPARGGLPGALLGGGFLAAGGVEGGPCTGPVQRRERRGGNNG